MVQSLCSSLILFSGLASELSQSHPVKQDICRAIWIFWQLCPPDTEVVSFTTFEHWHRVMVLLIYKINYPLRRGMMCMLGFFSTVAFLSLAWMTGVFRYKTLIVWLIIRRGRVKTFKDLTHFTLWYTYYLHIWVKNASIIHFPVLRESLGLISRNRRGAIEG